jgi:hypothetical protein
MFRTSTSKTLRTYRSATVIWYTVQWEPMTSTEGTASPVLKAFAGTHGGVNTDRHHNLDHYGFHPE